MKSPSHFDALLKSQGAPVWRLSDRRWMLLLVVLVLSSFVVQVDRVVTSPGKVIPHDRVKVIQHLEGGIIKNLLAREGLVVKAGDPLIELDLATSGINNAEMTARMAGFKLAKLRLEAESHYIPNPPWPGEVPPELQQLLEAERSTFRSRWSEHSNAMAAIEGQVQQGRQRVAELRAKLASLEASLKISEQEMAIAEGLVKEKLTSQLEYFQRKNALERQMGEIAMTRQTIPGALASVEEILARKREEESRFRRRASDELGELERKIASLNEELNRSNDQVDRSVIRSPIDGVVKNLRYQSTGNVIKPGEPVMEVVPLKEQLVVEVKLSPQDRGFVTVGQRAVVKISAYDYIRYGGLEGQVTSIAADTDIGRNDEQYFRLVVSTDKSYLGTEANQFPITSGMVSEVDIHVQPQSIFWMLIRPILKIRHEAFREV